MTRRWHTSMPSAHAISLAGLLCAILPSCSAPPIHPDATTTGGHMRAAASHVAQEAGEGAGARTAASDDPLALYHQVRAGEKLSDIAPSYGLTPQRLMQVNGLDADGGLKPGQLIYIPPSR